MIQSAYAETEEIINRFLPQGEMFNGRLHQI